MFMYSFVQHVPRQSLLRSHFLNTLIHIILIISYHNIIISSSSYLIISNLQAALYALSLCISPRLLRCRALPLVILLLASSPFWLAGLGVEPCIRYADRHRAVDIERRQQSVAREKYSITWCKAKPVGAHPLTPLAACLFVVNWSRAVVYGEVPMPAAPP